MASLMAPPEPEGEDLASLPGAVGFIEVRADLAGDPDTDWLRQRFGGQLIYALRSRNEGGAFVGSPSERAKRLARAATRYDLVELEGERDLTPDLLRKIPAKKRLISWHGKADLRGLKERFERFSAVQAKLYKFVSAAEHASDGFAPLLLLKSLGRSDVVAFADGEAGFWSRLVALRLGSPVVYGRVSSGRPVSGDVPVARLIQDYGLPELRPTEKIYGIVGNPVAHSLSPRLHNAAYRNLGHAALFVPFQAESFEGFWRDIVTGPGLEQLGLTLGGLTVASPHKEALADFAVKSTSMVRRVNSSNVLVRNNGGWMAGTTDPEGVSVVLADRGVAIAGKKAAVIGCGGAGRAIAAVLDEAGAEVTLVNRGFDRGDLASDLLGLPFVPLSEFDSRGFSILINATPVGREDDDTPFEVAGACEDAIIVDLVYSSGYTRLVSDSLNSGRIAIDGREVLLVQVERQFRMMTGRQMPEGLGQEVLAWDPPVAALV